MASSIWNSGTFEKAWIKHIWYIWWTVYAWNILHCQEFCERFFHELPLTWEKTEEGWNTPIFSLLNTTVLGEKVTQRLKLRKKNKFSLIYSIINISSKTWNLPKISVKEKFLSCNLHLVLEKPKEPMICLAFIKECEKCPQIQNFCEFRI